MIEELLNATPLELGLCIGVIVGVLGTLLIGKLLVWHARHSDKKEEEEP
jgi:hypothetical protein